MRKLEKKFLRSYDVSLRKKFTASLGEKLLICLTTGVVFGFAQNAGKQMQILSELPQVLADADRRYLLRLVREYEKDRLISFEKTETGNTRIVLTEAGKKKVLEFNFGILELKKPRRWDQVWRVVFFDVPEKKRQIRDAFRHKLMDLGFVELQRSVFVHPYPCVEEIEFLIEFLEARKFVRYGEMVNISNEAELRLVFNL